VTEKQARNYRKTETLPTENPIAVSPQENLARQDQRPPDELSDYLHESIPSQPSNESFDIT